MSSPASAFIGNSYVESIRLGNEECILFFHGFPGKVSNEDLAKHFASNFPLDTFVVHHEGLNRSRGNFRFIESLNNGMNIAQDILNFGYKRIHLYGNSWGGAVAFYIAAELDHQVGSLSLAAPFIFLPEPEHCKQIAMALMQEDSKISGRFNPDLVPNDILAIKSTYEPARAARQIKSAKVTLLHGKRDELLPLKATESLASLFDPSPRLVLMDQEHDFLDRKALVKELDVSLSASLMRK